MLFNIQWSKDYWEIVGVTNAEGPPVPIPNTEVKLCSGENTWLEAARENSSMPTQDRERIKPFPDPEKTEKQTTQLWGCSSAGRAPALQAGGHGFESHHLHHRDECPAWDLRPDTGNDANWEYLHAVRRVRGNEVTGEQLRSKCS